MRLRRRTATVEGRLIAACRSGLLRAAGSEEHVLWEGLVEGLTLKGRAQLLHPGELTADQERRAGGRLAGHMIMSRVRAAGPGPEQERLSPRGAQPRIDTLYFRYAGALVSRAGQRLLGDLQPDALLDAHGYACAQAAKHGPVSEMDEHELFWWLLDQAGAQSTPASLARLRAQRGARVSSGAADAG